MKKIKQVIKQLDLFEHTKLLRYDSQPSYRTLTGGLFSLILIILFIGLFANLVIDTFNNTIITQITKVSFDTQPTHFELKPSTEEKFMFAIGISGLDMGIQRYFDLKLQNFTSLKNTSGTFKTSSIVPLNICSIQQWEGINSQITSSFSTLNFTQWLCPPTGYVLPLQGKYTSNTFQYSRILVQKCGTISNSSTCATSTDVTTFINNNQGATLNFYFINSIINAGSSKYLDYYLEDRNYFAFDTATGVNANLYFSQYKIQTDHSVLPWADITEDQGAIAEGQASSQTFSVTSNNLYAKIHLRKSSERIDISRQFAKIDETLAYIGGLLGFLLLILAFMNFYSKFCYEIEFGDKIFKQNNNGSFGSQHFNFVVFLGYSIYNMFSKFGIYLKWKTMKKYHDCRVECVKQLDINLLFKKIEFLEEVGHIVLEDHHLKGLSMIPKKKIKDVQKSRRRFMLQAIIYHQLDRKGQEVNIESIEYKKRYEQYLKEHQHPEETQRQNKQPRSDQNNEKTLLKNFKKQCQVSYKKLKDQSHSGEKYSKKIFDRIGMKQILAAALFGQKKNSSANQTPFNSGVMLAQAQIEENLPTNNLMQSNEQIYSIDNMIDHSNRIIEENKGNGGKS